MSVLERVVIRLPRSVPQRFILHAEGTLLASWHSGELDRSRHPTLGVRDCLISFSEPRLRTKSSGQRTRCRIINRLVGGRSRFADFSATSDAAILCDATTRRADARNVARWRVGQQPLTTASLRVRSSITGPDRNRPFNAQVTFPCRSLTATVSVPRSRRRIGAARRSSWMPGDVGWKRGARLSPGWVPSIGKSAVTVKLRRGRCRSRACLTSRRVSARMAQGCG